MKKLIFISLVIMALVVPSTVFAVGTGTLSKQCYPAIKCSGTGGKTDAFGTPISCQKPISTIADCAAINPAYNAFNCSGGCYQMTNPPASPAPTCPTASLSGSVVPVLSAINNGGVAQLWDCATKALYSTLAIAPNGDVSLNPNIKNIDAGYTKAQCLTDGGTAEGFPVVNKCYYPVNVTSGLGVKDHSGNKVLKVNDYGQISNPSAGNGVAIKDQDGLEVWQDVLANANHFTIDPTNGISYTSGDAGIYSPVTINDALDVRNEITNLGGASSPVTFQDADGLKVIDTAIKPYNADLHIDPVHGFERYFNDVAFSSSKTIPNTAAAENDCWASGAWPTRLNTTTPHCNTNFGFYGGVTTFGQDNNDVALVIDNDTGFISANDTAPVTIDDHDGLVTNGPITARTNTLWINALYTATNCTNDGGTVIFTILPPPHDKYCKFSEGDMTVDGTLSVAGNTDLGNTTFHSNATGNLFTGNSFHANVDVTAPTVSATTVDASGHISAGGGVGSYSTVDSGVVTIAAGGNDASSISCATGGISTGCGYWVSSGAATSVYVYDLYSNGNYCNVYAKNNGGASINFHRYVRCFDPNG